LIGGVLGQTLPGFLGGTNEAQQQVNQAKSNFITAVLRKESGAVISDSEFDREDKKYFPQINDSEKVIKQKENARKLKELLRKQELGQLGLTEEEKQRLYREQLGATTKAASDVRAQQSGIAASLATGAGRAAIDRAIQEEGVVRARAAAQETVTAEDLKKVADQEAEIEKRMGIVSDQQVANRQALGQVAQQGAGMIVQEVERIKTVRGAKPSPEQLKALSEYTGMSTDQLGPALEYFASNPESASILSDILSAGKAGVVGAK
jgi:hypothetical protein